MGPNMGTDPVSPTLSSSPTLPSSPTVPRRENVLVESRDIDTLEPSVSLQACTSPAHEVSDVESASPIAKRVRNDPRTRHPSMLQISPYLNLVTKVYKSRKHAISHPLDEEDLVEKVEGDRGGQRIEVHNCYCYSTTSVQFLIRGTTHCSS